MFEQSRDILSLIKISLSGEKNCYHYIDVAKCYFPFTSKRLLVFLNKNCSKKHLFRSRVIREFFIQMFFFVVNNKRSPLTSRMQFVL